MKNSDSTTYPYKLKSMFVLYTYIVIYTIYNIHYRVIYCHRHLNYSTFYYHGVELATN